MNASQFSKKYPVGTPVHYYPIIGGNEFVETIIRSEAWKLPSGHIVVKVNGRAGGVSIEAIKSAQQRLARDAASGV